MGRRLNKYCSLSIKAIRLFGEWNPHEWVIHTRGKTFSFLQEDSICKSVLKLSLWGKQIPETCLSFEYVFKGFSKKTFLENPLQNLNEVTDFSQEKS